MNTAGREWAVVYPCGSYESNALQILTVGSIWFSTFCLDSFLLPVVVGVANDGNSDEARSVKMN